MTRLSPALRDSWGVLPADGGPALAVALPDGAVVLLRTPQPGDGERLRRLFYRLSPVTIHRWFFVAAPRLPEWAAALTRLAEVDGVDHAATVAAVGDEVVGIARYDRPAPGPEAEVAILIEDAWQGRGLGRLLIARLGAEAAHRRIAAFTATILGENRRAVALVSRQFAGAEVRFRGGEYRLRVRLDAPDPADVS